jgi:hypothetical protein
MQAFMAANIVFLGFRRFGPGVFLNRRSRISREKDACMIIASSEEFNTCGVDEIGAFGKRAVISNLHAP